MALLDVHGLVKYFGRRRVVKGVSFSVNPGEVVGLLGPNGAGKTTSFRMATGQIAPNDGRVVFNGEDVTHLPMYQRARRGMGYLAQEPSVFRKLSVEKNLIAILEALPRSRTLGRRLTRGERWDRANEALARFKLEHVRRSTAGRCSGGEKRRLEIARCLVCEPLLILLDEPFAAVDPKTKEDIRNNIRDLAGHGIGILLTDHDVREVFRSADRVYLIHEGEVVTEGTPHQLVNDQRAIDAYLGRSFEEDGFTRQFAARAHTLPTGAVPAPQPLPAQPRPQPAPAASVPPPPPPKPGPGPRPEPPAAPSPPARQSAAPVLPTRPNLAPAPPAVSAVTPPPAAAPRAKPAPAPNPLSTVTPPPAPAPRPTPPAAPASTPAPAGTLSGVVGGILELQLIARAVESLADDGKVKAATVELVGKGPAAVPALLEALERREAVLRKRAFEVLQFVVRKTDHPGPLEFDPDAPADVRLRQVAYLRAKLERRP